MSDFKYFDYSEFDSPDKPGSGEKFMSKRLIEMLDEARELADVPFVITSGYRTRSHNKKVGGVDGSSHTKGLAVDIACRDNSARFKMIEAFREVGFTRIGIGRTFIHVDIDTTKSQNVIWHYY